MIAWIGSGKTKFEGAGERARRVHGQWLTWAFAQKGRAWPWIPLHRTGVAPARPAPGSEWHEAWWDAALARLD